MKYRNRDTGATFTAEELKVAYDQFKHEMNFSSFDEFVEEFEKVETMEFDDYGIAEYVSPEEFYTDGWSIAGRATGSDGEEYDILLSLDKTTYGYSNI